MFLYLQGIVNPDTSEHTGHTVHNKRIMCTFLINFSSSHQWILSICYQYYTLYPYWTKLLHLKTSLIKSFLLRSQPYLPASVLNYLLCDSLSDFIRTSNPLRPCLLPPLQAPLVYLVSSSLGGPWSAISVTSASHPHSLIPLWDLCMAPNQQNLNPRWNQPVHHPSILHSNQESLEKITQWDTIVTTINYLHKPQLSLQNCTTNVLNFLKLLLQFQWLS